MTGETYAISVQYLQTASLAATMTSVTLAGAAALRGAGDTATPMWLLGSVNVINVIVSASLVFGFGPIPSVGVKGIVLGTVAARVLGGVAMIVLLRQGRSGLRLRWTELRPRREPVGQVLRIGFPAAADGAVMWTGHFLFLMIIARLDPGGLAGAYYAAHFVGVRLEAVTYLPAVAWAAAAATMIGQNLGAGFPQRARRSGHEGAGQCALLGAAAGVAFFFCAERLFALMSNDAQVRSVGVTPFRVIACFQPFLAAAIVYVGALRGAGDTRYPLLITVMGVGFVRLPLAYYLGSTLGMGLLGAWLAMCSDFVLRAILAWGRFVRGRWIRLVV